MRKVAIYLVFSASLWMSCSQDTPSPSASVPTDHSSSVAGEVSFEHVDAAASGIDFVNKVDEFDAKINYFSFNQIYSGSGVATGDLNNDGLVDVFFQSGFQGGSLYANRGDMTFEKIALTDALFNLRGAGTGITLVDINGDGLLDVYLCYSGPSGLPSSMKDNRLLINKGDFRFEEAAEAYGIADTGNSIQSAFFDYDKDGDLDMYLVNTNADLKYAEYVVDSDRLRFADKTIAKLNAQDRFYRNDGGKYVDITETSGLIPEYFYGFNPTIGDYNNDGWPDVYVTCDFTTPDLLYLNQQDGTFKESSAEVLKHTSFYSMGADAADVNNDGLDDIIAVDMTPEDYRRSRENMGMVEIDLFQRMVSSGWGKQYMHNMLHINTGIRGFQEISQFAGVDKTDWSWAVLNEDFNNDGHKDMFVTNGIKREIVNKDAYNQRTEWILENNQELDYENFVKLVKGIPSEPISNYLFVNKGDLQYSKTHSPAIADNPSFSNGASAADLDNDGDLDLIVNNFDQPAFLLENTSTARPYIDIRLEGSPANRFGIGAKVCVHTDAGMQCQTINPSRGFMSSVNPVAHFGLGNGQQIQKVEITWIDGKQQTLPQGKINTTLTLKHADARAGQPMHVKRSYTIARSLSTPLPAHRENDFNDFEDQKLLPHKLSNLSPALAVGDVNADGIDDLYIGSGPSQSSAIYLGVSDGTYTLLAQPSLESDMIAEDSDAQLVDIDGDQDLDLIVVGGSFEYAEGSPQTRLRMYTNDGRGLFSAHNYGKDIYCNSMTIATSDIDGDGDVDLFVGGRVIKDKYPYPPKSYILRNDGGTFTDVTSAVAPEISDIGMVTDAVFADMDNDQDVDLVLTGEWMPITVLTNNAGDFTKDDIPSITKTAGWWNTIEVADFNGDGRMDLAAGNLGLNYKFSASEEKSFQVFCDDFDDNGSYDIVLAKPIADELYPVRGKMCSSEQMPFLKEEFPTFNDFASANLIDLYGEKLDESYQLEATKFESCVLLREADGAFKVIDLPNHAQLSPIKDMIALDINGDGHMDLLTAGNLYDAEVETSQADAGVGCTLMGRGDGTFEWKSHLETGFFADTDVRRMQMTQGKQRHLVVTNNSAAPLIFAME